MNRAGCWLDWNEQEAHWRGAKREWNSDIGRRKRLPHKPSDGWARKGLVGELGCFT